MKNFLYILLYTCSTYSSISHIAKNLKKIPLDFQKIPIAYYSLNTIIPRIQYKAHDITKNLYYKNSLIDSTILKPQFNFTNLIKINTEMALPKYTQNKLIVSSMSQSSQLSIPKKIDQLKNILKESRNIKDIKKK
jgi:hypothetical protein